MRRDKLFYLENNGNFEGDDVFIEKGYFLVFEVHEMIRNGLQGKLRFFVLNVFGIKRN